MAGAELEVRAGIQEIGRGRDVVTGVELRALVAEDFDAVDAMDDLIVAADLGLDLHPLLGREGRGLGLDDVLGDKFALELKVGAGTADARRGPVALALVGEELELEAARKTLIEAHALRRLGMDHHAAVEVHVLGGVGHHLAGEAVFHP